MVAISGALCHFGRKSRKIVKIRRNQGPVRKLRFPTELLVKIFLTFFFWKIFEFSFKNFWKISLIFFLNFQFSNFKKDLYSISNNSEQYKSSCFTSVQAFWLVARSTNQKVCLCLYYPTSTWKTSYRSLWRWLCFGSNESTSGKNQLFGKVSKIFLKYFFNNFSNFFFTNFHFTF